MIRIGDYVDNRYRIESRIATGGMADIYEANDLVGRRIVCLKVMKSELLNDHKNIERFEKETEAVASLNNPNIVKVYGRGIIQGRPYMTTEYIKGQTLRDKLNNQGSLTIPEACEIMLQVSAGVSYIHKHNILHRDIKPENIFYLADGTVKIADFGISSIIGEKSDGDSVQGTVYYCAPEILIGKPAKETSDIYSMGILFFELLTGRVPFEGNNPEEVAVMHIKNHFVEPSKVLPSIPKSFDKIIIKACRKSPEDRYQSADEFNKIIRETMSNKENFIIKKGFFRKLFGFK